MTTTSSRTHTRALKRGDSPLIRATLLDANGEGVDLSFPSTDVRFSMRDTETGILKVNLAAGEGSEDGVVSYRFAPTDTDTPGIYEADFRITLPDASVLHLPADAADDFNFMTIVITEPVA
jgi:hypothetical protein